MAVIIFDMRPEEVKELAEKVILLIDWERAIEDEEVLGPLMKPYKPYFWSSKTRQRTYKEASEEARVRGLWIPSYLYKDLRKRVEMLADAATGMLRSKNHISGLTMGLTCQQLADLAIVM